jgi:hypothetical protein
LLEVFIFDIKEIGKAENFNAVLLSKFEICSFQKIVTKQTTLWEKATGTFFIQTNKDTFLILAQ